MMSHGERCALRRLENTTGMKAIVDRWRPNRRPQLDHGILSGKLLYPIEQIGRKCAIGGRLMRPRVSY
jgi:hypothetical protein